MPYSLLHAPVEPRTAFVCDVDPYQVMGGVEDGEGKSCISVIKEGRMCHKATEYVANRSCGLNNYKAWSFPALSTAATEV